VRVPDRAPAPFRSPPGSACWEHRGARSGFEVTYIQDRDGGWRIDGTTAALEDGRPWVVTYSVQVDRAWVTRDAHIAARTAAGSGETLLSADGQGRWLVDGRRAPQLEGCLDVDLESSAMTNALPVHRLALPPGARAGAPAAYVRVLDLAVRRLDQQYVRLDDEDGRQRYDYAAPEFAFQCQLAYDESGLVLDYPGIAARAG
jgi:uncharacterized protein